MFRCRSNLSSCSLSLCGEPALPFLAVIRYRVMHALCLSRILRLSTDSKLFHLAMKDLLIDRDTYLPPSQEVSRLSRAGSISERTFPVFFDLPDTRDFRSFHPDFGSLDAQARRPE
jgi:hypothetical protein